MADKRNPTVHSRTAFNLAAAGIVVLAVCLAGCTSSGTVRQSTSPGTTASPPVTQPSTTSASASQPETPTRTAAHSPTPAAPVPTLGAKWYSNGQGFGTVRPATIYNGGDPTGLLMKITWSTWGGPTATGTGTGYYEPPNAPVAAVTPQPADVRAFDLGTCNGKPAYLRVQWWFPGEGQTFHSTGDEARYNICTGAA